MDTNKLSIVVPVYNVEKYVRKCILSFVNQDENYFQGIELIIVNDGTKDNSVEQIRDLVDKYSNITLVNQENKGLSEARNTGMDIANGEYVWFVDSDDWIQPDSLKKLQPYLDGINDVVVVGAYKVYDDKKETFNVFFDHINSLSGNATYKNGVAQMHTAQFSIYRKSFLENNNLRFMPGIYHEDEEFCPKVSFKSRLTTYLPYCLYNLNVSTSDGRQSITTVPNPKRAFDSLRVADSLSRFLNEFVDDNLIKSKFDNFISMVINNALSVIVRNSKEEQERFNKEYSFNYKHITKHLSKGSKKYKLEAYILRFFPNDIVGIYKLLQKFNIK